MTMAGAVPIVRAMVREMEMEMAMARKANWRGPRCLSRAFLATPQVLFFAGASVASFSTAALTAAAGLVTRGRASPGRPRGAADGSAVCRAVTPTADTLARRRATLAHHARHCHAKSRSLPCGASAGGGRGQFTACCVCTGLTRRQPRQATRPCGRGRGSATRRARGRLPRTQPPCRGEKFEGRSCAIQTETAPELV